MSIDLYRLARLLEETALLMEINGENKFKSKAYSDGAEIIRRQTDTVNNASSPEELQKIDGIGKALSEKIHHYKQTSELKVYDDITARVPESLLSLAKLKGLGPKRTAQIWKSLDIVDLSMLDNAIKSGSLVKEKGFGAKTVATIKKNLDYVKRKQGHVLLSTGIEIAERLATGLLELDKVAKAGIVGDISLANDTVGSIELVIATNRDSTPKEFTESQKSKINELIEIGEFIESDKYLDTYITESSSKKPAVRLIVCNHDDFHWICNEFSMDSEFSEAYHSFLKDTGWKFQDGFAHKGGEKVVFDAAKDVYDKVGLQYVLREIRSEAQTIHFAANGYLPDLVELDDIKGLVHMHTTWSDGKNTTREMAEAAMKRGLTYMLVTDHSQSAGYAGGLKPKDIKLQHQEIDKLNEEYKGRFTILKGIESDILADGSLDYDDEVLSSFDAVVGSIHGQFDLHPEQQTERLVNALKNPYLHILGHSTGRLLLRRPGYEFDMHKIIDTAAEYGKVIEINSNPYRLDLPWEYIKDAKIKGVKFSINPDAHNTLGIFHVEYGVKIARKGWLTKADIVNTLDSRGFLSALNKSGN